ncbi:hypothetical protein ACX3YG_14440 [Pseudomonas wadenswilerensis]
MNVGTAIPDPHQAAAAQLSDQVAAYLAAGGKVTVGQPFNYVPRPAARFNNQAPVKERKDAAQKRRDELAKRNAQVRELAKTMTYSEAAKATGIAMATLHRIAKEGDFLFQISEGRSGNGRKIDRKADAVKLERLVYLRDCGLSRNAVAKRMDISDKLIERLISDYSIDFPARGLRR